VPPRRLEAVSLDVLDLRRDERGLLVGTTDAGKSTLAEYLGLNFVRRYKARRLILDSKPRYRAEWMFNGLPAKRLYKRYKPDPHAFVAGSIVITPDLTESPKKLLAQAFTRTNTVIASIPSKGYIPWLVAVAAAFKELGSYRKPGLLHVDETLDFFTTNGNPIGGDAIEVSARAGREVGEAGLYCSQRTYKLSQALLAEMTRLYAFMLTNVNDAKRFQEFGCPPFATPRRLREFKYWYKKDPGHVYGPYALDLAA
jgi:hypothetical protein